MLIKIVIVIFVLIAVIVALHFIYRPPSLEGRSISKSVQGTAATLLGRLGLAAPPEMHGKSGVVPLVDGPGAFVARVALIRTAEVALDVQYYIWQRDATGLILLDELYKAAQRGVRIRLLLDDNGISGLDGDLAALDALPNVEIRLYNPFILRKPKLLGYAFDFVRLNRRMHNKSMTADGSVSILGGRNVGDIYFGFGTGVHYADTDVIVAGPVAAEIGADFDKYWASGSVHPVDRILSAAPAGALERLIQDAADAAKSEDGQRYFEKLKGSTIARDLLAERLEFEWTTVSLISDDPAKGLGHAAKRDLLFPQLMALLSRPKHSIDLVSAYFVPGKRFAQRLQSLAGLGVRVRILTNSQAATDVAVVHSAYVRYRPRLLRSKAELFELRPEHAPTNEPEPKGIGGSSRASLHSKTLAVDGERIFIGSFNFDPRSLLLNTEMGVLIDSPSIAGALTHAFDHDFPRASYIPEMNQKDRIVWAQTSADGSVVLIKREPGTTALSRFGLWLLGRLPIEWLL